MKISSRVVLLIGLGLSWVAWPRFAAAQACKDEQSIWQDSKKSVVELVATIRRESVADFERSYHQKTVVSRLNFFSSTLQELLTCLDKTAQDPASSKETVEACKAQHETYAKLKEQADRDIDALKAQTDSKEAKEYAGKLSEIA
jgi:hypothetical protein